MNKKTYITEDGREKLKRYIYVFYRLGSYNDIDSEMRKHPEYEIINVTPNPNKSYSADFVIWMKLKDDEEFIDGI